MKPLIDMATWFLEKEIRAKNAVSFLIALVTVAGVYLCAQGSTWMTDLDKRGPWGLPVALVVVFLVTFLSSWLIGEAINRSLERRSAKRRQELAASRKEEQILETLSGLTDWQRRFVTRYLTERTTQIADFEVGGYRAAWDFEMEMLVQKGVVHHHGRARVYEIDPHYRKFLEMHLDLDSGKLG
jgi:hypothetical protein